MNPALISGLISALVILLGAIGWLLKLRAAMVDVYDEIRANATTLRQLGNVRSIRHPGTFSVEAHRRSGALVSQGCSRAACSAIADAYFHVARRRRRGSTRRHARPHHDGTDHCVPKHADAGLLSTERIGSAATPDVAGTLPPRTWHRPPTLPGGSLRRLTVNFLECAYAAGAHELITPGGVAQINQPEALEALRFMVRGIRNSVAPFAVVNQKEAESSRAFLRGKADFMRNWPAAREDIDGSRLARHVAVASLPAWKDGNQASVLGGHNLVISGFSRNPAAALKLVDYLTQSDVIRQDAIEHAQPPVLRDLWQDSAVRRALPAPDALAKAIRDGNAEIRPVAPNYKAVSEAIYTNVNRALIGDTTPEQALQTANEEMQQALDDANRNSSR
jgi:hypothetical protein